MSELRDDFQSTVEDIAHDAKEIEKIEDEKADLDPADPRAATLSARAEEFAERLHHKTLAEREIADTAGEAG